MKSIKSFLILLLLLGPITAPVALADHGHFGGFRGFHGSRGGVFIDPWPLLYPFAAFSYGYGYSPYGYYPYAAYPPAVVQQQAAPTVYVEQGASAPEQQSNAPARSQAAPASNEWYYCHKPDGYYPYVRNCPGGWQRVPSQPPAQH